MDTFLKRLITVLVSLFLLVYVGFQAYQILNTTIEVETVGSYKVYETIETKGVAIRNETVVSQGADGYLFYTTENGGRVAKDGTIARVFPSENDAFSQQQLDLLDEEIETLRAINAQGTSNRANLSGINKQLNRAWLSAVEGAQSPSFLNMPELRADLLALLNRQQITIGRVENFNDRLAALTSARDTLAGSFSKSTSEIRSPIAGYFVSRIDGYEASLTADKAADLTPEEVGKALAGSTAGTASGIGKVVGDYDWYLACVLPVEQAAQMKEGAELTVRLPFVLNQAIPVRVAATNKDRAGQVAVIFECSQMSKELSSIRIEQVQIQLKEYEGLRVPDEAIQFNDKQESGVYVRVGNALSFKRIKVLYHSEDGDSRFVLDNLGRIEERIAAACAAAGRKREDVTLLAVTKTVPPARINAAIGAGVTHIGENRVQEFLGKRDALRLDGVDVHLIGHLQTNKVRQIVGRVGMIESVDSLRLAEAISQASLREDNTRILPVGYTEVLVEVNIGGEEQKTGVAPERLEELLYAMAALPGIRVRGLMTVPPILTAPEEQRRVFSQMYKLFIDIRGKNIDNIRMDMLSMGMSSDYEQAILEGSTLVRIGSALFGRRL